MLENNELNIKLTPQEIEAMEMFFEIGDISSIQVQKRFYLGFADAARLMDSLEDKNVISSPNKKGKRDFLITRSQFEIMKK